MAKHFLQRSRHGTVYLFRRRVPADLTAVIGKPTLVRSLGTESRRIAVVRARDLAAQSDKLFAQLRVDMGKKKTPEIVQWGYTLDVRPDGTISSIATDGTRDDHENVVQMVQVLRGAGPAPQATQNAKTVAPEDQIELAAAVEGYLKRGVLSPSSAKTYRSALVNHLVGHFGTERLISTIRSVSMQRTQPKFGQWIDRQPL